MNTKYEDRKYGICKNRISNSVVFFCMFILAFLLVACSGSPDTQQIEPECGDDFCAESETEESCPQDCLSECGNGTCSDDEDIESCPEDCASSCGDNICAEDETAEHCPADCYALCGDTHCTHDETPILCPADCPSDCGDEFCTHDETVVTCENDCPADCGDELCTHDETVLTCPGDCQAICGDERCTHSENASTCPADCPADCGDGDCTHDETALTCPTDCPADCGDGACTHSEDVSICPADCPVSCGDEECSHDETAISCPADCPSRCGDKACTHEEDAIDCPSDCPSRCGDEACTHDETALLCPGDCPSRCGDEACTHDESAINCPRDCPSSCRDGECTHDESASTCPVDCPARCGDEFCTHDENVISCPEDCPAICGDELCSHDESPVECGSDCLAECGDGLCTHAENTLSCPEDCMATCGDGVRQDYEICDDGNRIDETECSYGTRTCVACNETCSAQLELHGNYCGDGIHDDAHGEYCDDGYNDPCGSCNATCDGDGTGSTCGDGAVCPETEVCDDGERDGCDSCNATCTGLGNGVICDGEDERCLENFPRWECVQIAQLVYELTSEETYGRYIGDIRAFAEEAYFSVYDYDEDVEIPTWQLWSSDGSAENTEMVDSFDTCNRNRLRNHLAPHDGNLYFLVDGEDASYCDLASIDGSTLLLNTHVASIRTGTNQLASTNLGLLLGNSSLIDEGFEVTRFFSDVDDEFHGAPSRFVSMDESLYFFTYSDFGWDMGVTLGTLESTSRIGGRNHRSRLIGGEPRYPTVVRDHIYFTASYEGHRLWTYSPDDGHIRSLTGDRFDHVNNEIVAFQDRIYFTKSREIFYWDRASETEISLDAFLPALSGPNGRGLVSTSTALYYGAGSNTLNRIVWEGGSPVVNPVMTFSHEDTLRNPEISRIFALDTGVIFVFRNEIWYVSNDSDTPYRLALTSIPSTHDIHRVIAAGDTLFLVTDRSNLYSIPLP